MKHCLATFVFAMLAAAMPAAQQRPVSLGDLSRQVESDRTTGKKATKSYTNKDLNQDPKAVSTAEQAPPDGYISSTTGQKVSAEELVTRSQEKVDAESASAAMSEAHWKQRADYLRGEFSRAQERINKLKELPQPAALPARARLENEFAMVRQMVDGLTKQWARLEESARVAKIPADWIGEKPTFEQ